jgi:plasmid stabilization system protein ParE
LDHTSWQRSIGHQRLPAAKLPAVRRTYRAQDLLAYPFAENLAAPGKTRPPHRDKRIPLTPLLYIVVYAIRDEAIEILRIYHGAQEWR